MVPLLSLKGRMRCRFTKSAGNARNASGETSSPARVPIFGNRTILADTALAARARSLRLSPICGKFMHPAYVRLPFFNKLRSPRAALFGQFKPFSINDWRLWFRTIDNVQRQKLQEYSLGGCGLSES